MDATAHRAHRRRNPLAVRLLEPTQAERERATMTNLLAAFDGPVFLLAVILEEPPRPGPKPAASLALSAAEEALRDLTRRVDDLTEQAGVQAERDSAEAAPAQLVAVDEAVARLGEALQPLAITLPADAFDQLVERVAAVVVDRLRVSLEPEQPRPFLTVPEAASYIGSKRQRVYDLLSSGRIKRYKDGTRVLIKREELDAYLAGRLSR